MTITIETKLGPAPQATSSLYQGTLVDQAGAAVPGTTLETLALTLYDDTTGTIINSRNAQNVLNANGVTVDVNGLLTWTLTPADMPMVNDAMSSEVHHALFEATWASGTRGFTHRVAITVTNKWRRP